MDIYFYNTLTKQKDLFKPIEEGKVGLSTAGSLYCQGQQAFRAGREAIRSCSGDARSDGCDIGRLPQVFLPKLERCALDTRTPHQGSRSSLETLPSSSL